MSGSERIVSISQKSIHPVLARQKNLALFFRVRPGRAFTLIELLVIIAIIAILAANPGGAYFPSCGMNMNLSPWNLPLPATNWQTLGTVTAEATGAMHFADTNAGTWPGDFTGFPIEILPYKTETDIPMPMTSTNQPAAMPDLPET